MSQADNSKSYLQNEILKKARYLVVITDQSGLIERLECPGIEWQIEGLRMGGKLPETLQAVIDACEGSTTPQLFDYVQLADNVSADVHVLNRATEKQIILQDVSKGYADEHRFQQKAHEVSLLLEKQSELTRLLEEKRAEAEQASQAKSHFIALMSHEFKSPISSIMAHADALHGELPGAQQPAAIQRASWYLLTLVENLLEQARTDEEKLRIDLSVVDVPALLNDMQELFEIQANARDITFEIERSDNTGWVQADELRLRQVLVNLISNAVRYTREGGIRLLCKRQGEFIQFCVADTGKGIDEGDMERIFRPFTRVNPDGEGGAGLGLTISRKLLASMNSDLNVQSKIGKGSSFSFILPVPEEDQLKSIGNLEGLSVLLVEDDYDIREMYRIWLEDWGIDIRSVSGFEQAVVEFRDNPVDLVLSDLFLEDGNGVELLTHVRRTQPGVATVLCSGSDSIGEYLGGKKSDIDCFVSKPVSASRLEAALRSVVQGRNST